MKHRLLIGATALLVAAAGGALAVAQQAPAAQKSIWEGVYTQDQADRGAAAYGVNCANCHGANLDGDARFRALQGDVFQGRWDTRTVGALFNYVSVNMPNGRGGSLPPGTYQDLIAFILSRNDFPAGTTELTPESVKAVQIIGRDGIPRPMADKTVAGVIGCLVKGGASGWMLNSATPPRRLDDANVPSDAATVALGETNELPLLFVLSSLDRINGHRVFVRGLLVGENGANGINVTEVRSVGEACP